LDTIGKLEVGMGKVEYEGNLNMLFNDDIKKFIQYNLTDIDIVDALDNKLKLIELAQTICHVCHVPYDFIHFSSKFLEGGLLTYLRKDNLIAPNKPRVEKKSEDEESDEVGFEGAYVKMPTPGRYEWIFDLDLTSLYPSIIMSLNISPETLVGKVFSKMSEPKPKYAGKKGEMIPSHPVWSPEDFATGKMEKVFLTYDACERDAPIGDPSVVSFDKFYDKIISEDLSIAANGAMYRNDRMGLLGDILDTWFKQRVEFRKLEKQYGKEGNQELYRFYNKRQKVQKILLNSLYGVLGLSSFRFYNLINAEAVTLTGQTIIKTTEKMGNQYYNAVLKKPRDTDHCIYVDTDSVFFSALPIIRETMPDVDETDNRAMAKAVIDVAGIVQGKINEGYNIMSKKMFNIEPAKHRFDIKQEVVSKRGIWITKKRYVHWIIDEGGVPKDELEIKGLDVVRSSFPTTFKKFMYIKKDKTGFLMDLLSDVPKEEIDDKIISLKANIEDEPLEEMARNTGLKNVAKFEVYTVGQPIGVFPKYKNDKGKSGSYPAHVKAGINFNKFLEHFGLEKKVETIKNGEKIKYVFLKDNELGIKEIAFRGYQDPPQLMEFINKYVDPTLMFEKELEKKLHDFYDALGWTYPSVADKTINTFFEF